MSNPAQGAVGAETMTAGQSLDLRDLHAANIARQAEWCPDQVPDLSFRGNELGGECGEAQNVIKKLERERQGWRGSRATKDDLADELADVVICADLCAVTADIDLGAAVRRKFNATSEKQGLSVFLPLPALASPRADSDERTAGNWRKVMRDLISEHDKHVCLHEETHRGGAIWTICDHCGRKWADDEGGFQPYEEPAAVTAAWALLRCEHATPAQPAGAVPDSLRALIREIVNATYAMTAAPLGTEVARLYRAAQPLAEFISTHPAGHSAGPALCSYIECAALGKSSCEDCRDTPHHAGQIAGSGAGPAAFDWVKRAADAIPPGPTGPVRVLSGPEEAPGLLDQVSSEQAEAFERTASNLVNLYAPDGPSALRQGILAALLRAHLAARPAAPEAQGTWQPVPAPPASSGQGGR